MIPSLKVSPGFCIISENQQEIFNWNFCTKIYRINGERDKQKVATMEIVKVSMVGANENLSVKDVLDFLLKNPMAEIGIGISREKGAFNTPRFNWVMRLQRGYEEIVENGRRKIGRVGLHINGKNAPYTEKPYPLMIIDDAKIPDTLRILSRDWRVTFQLNFSNYKINHADIYSAARCLGETGQTIVIPYNHKTQEYVFEFVHSFRRRYNSECGGIPLQILYDSSFGNGKSAIDYKQPVFGGIVQGYTGGFRVDNIQQELDKISAVQTCHDAKIYIDAESGLSGEQNTIDLNKADAFCKNVMDWVKTRQEKIKS